MSDSESCSSHCDRRRRRCHSPVSQTKASIASAYGDLRALEEQTLQTLLSTSGVPVQFTHLVPVAAGTQWQLVPSSGNLQFIGPDKTAVRVTLSIDVSRISGNLADNFGIGVVAQDPSVTVPVAWSSIPPQQRQIFGSSVFPSAGSSYYFVFDALLQPVNRNQVLWFALYDTADVGSCLVNWNTFQRGNVILETTLPNP